MVCDLMAGFAERGLESVVFCTDSEGELYSTAPASAKGCGHRKPGLLIIDWRLVFQMVRFVKANEVNLLHAHNHAQTLYCVLVSLLTGIPVIVTRHGQGYKTLRWKLLTRLLALRARLVVLVSEDSKRVAMVNHSVPERKAIVIHNGIDVRRFAPEESGVRSQKSEGNSSTTKQLGNQQPFTELREKLGIPADAVIIGSVGRLSWEKNYSLLVRAFARVVQQKTIYATGASTSRGDPDPETINRCEALGGRTSCEPSYDHGSDKPRPPKEQSASDEGRFNAAVTGGYSLRSPTQAGASVAHKVFLLLIGDGPDRPLIEAEIARHTLQDRCYITGMQAEVLPWLQALDIFCLSSDTEGLSISLLEAGSCGLPCVVTDAGGNREIVKDGASGFVVPVKDEVALAARFEQLVCDAELRHTMGQTARQLIEERFSRSTMVDGYFKVYANAIN